MHSIEFGRMASTDGNLTRVHDHVYSVIIAILANEMPRERTALVEYPPAPGSGFVIKRGHASASSKSVPRNRAEVCGIAPGERVIVEERRSRDCRATAISDDCVDGDRRFEFLAAVNPGDSGQHEGSQPNSPRLVVRHRREGPD